MNHKKEKVLQYLLNYRRSSKITMLKIYEIFSCKINKLGSELFSMYTFIYCTTYLACYYNYEFVFKVQQEITRSNFPHCIDVYFLYIVMF